MCPNLILFSSRSINMISGALAAALEMRRQNMGIDDSSDEDGKWILENF